MPKICPTCPLTSPSRRTLLQGAAVVVAGWLTPAAAGAQEPRAARPVRGDLLVRNGDATATPLTPADIKSGAPTVAWPMAADGTLRNGSRLNRVVLVRLEPAVLAEQTRARAADGIVAYSAVCTHTGCEVGSFLTDEQALYCECHQSKFDARDAARVTDGPAPRNLPALPLAVADGRLIVTGPFSTRPGFEQG